MKNIIESWYPADMGEYVLFAEDDIELSKHWYAWVKDAVFRYASAPVCRVCVCQMKCCCCEYLDTLWRLRNPGTVRLRYRFGGSHDATRDPKIFGVSLYTPREMETTPPAQRTDFFHPWNILQNGDRPYLHQMPCSWGAVYFPGAQRAHTHTNTHTVYCCRLSLTLKPPIAVRQNTGERFAAT